MLHYWSITIYWTFVFIHQRYLWNHSMQKCLSSINKTTHKLNGYCINIKSVGVWWTRSIGGSRGAPGTHASGGLSSFIFMQFSAKIWKIIAILGVGSPPWGKSWIRHCEGLKLKEGSLILPYRQQAKPNSIDRNTPSVIFQDYKNDTIAK